ncbi:DUF3097 domain-containing protein [Cryobacterium sp. TMT1-21]|uniref:DUF3097 domain-containing protein n=2 Tax=Microbacteriaceae TaxID=85023 RepID=A0AAQ2C6K0_9MICO|nr:DUF3097 domain-containing protein [Cryobacterium shii]TFC81830.1 DUF3097 domain-containing protein [Cryobacterium sp. TmT2-59]TFD08301.1 DUF3097 domain-containing protein [Cryobacterium sp. TMT1-21]TFD20694.1 DUF3097 domain-containing protein [Cryobacterium sp. TMT4-10]TFD24693.1 DUF3097 domain-containing protein [Cryobacterium sp. TMT2-23]TFD38962.1 DUF3097 domain-containing protein [Cryobacterium sp. TMT2-10]
MQGRNVQGRDEADRYSADVLSPGWREVGRTIVPTQEATPDLVVEEVATGFCGAVIRIEKKIVTLEDRHGKLRLFPLGGGFLLDGQPVVLVAPKPRTPQGRARTASGSVAVTDAPARVARGSRIFVEGRHDAELVEKVWGADLRIEGVVVEYIEGVDNLEELLAEFRPAPGRRVGMLVDHLVAGSKESRIAQAVASGPHGRNVLVVGHPYVDVWQAVKPERLGWEAWPVIPRTIEWKHGICEALGWPHEEQADIARAWQRILGRVRSYADLEPQFLGRVEQLIDFVTVE